VRAGRYDPHGYGTIVNGEDDEAETPVSEAETTETPCTKRYDMKDP